MIEYQRKWGTVHTQCIPAKGWVYSLTYEDQHGVIVKVYSPDKEGFATSGAAFSHAKQRYVKLTSKAKV